MTKKANPLKLFDFQSIFHNAKIPGFDIDAIIAAQKKNVEAVVGANQTVTEGFQAITKRQLKVAQTMVQDTGVRMADLMGDTALRERMAKQAELAKSGIEQAAQSMREVSEVLGKAQTEAFALIKRRMDESLDEIKDFKAA